MTNAGYTLGGVHPALSFMGKRKAKRELFLLCSTLGNDLSLRFDPLPTLGNDLSLRFAPFPTLGNDLILRFDPFPTLGNDLALRFDLFPTLGNDLSLRFDLFPTLGNDLALRFAPFPTLGWIPFHTLDSKKRIGPCTSHLRPLPKRWRK